MSRSILWPRHEVLQLVLPIFTSCGKTLSNKLIMDVAKKLVEVENSYGIVSFEDFSSVAVEILKWNENVVQLFWDMLHAAIWYKVQMGINSDEAATDYILLFLVLHISETASKSPGVSHYDTVWPGQADTSAVSAEQHSHAVEKRFTFGDTTPHSPTNSQHKSFASLGPKSPRSSSLPSSVSPTSPRSSLSSPRSRLLSSNQRPNAASHLNTIRQRLPIMLRVLSLRNNTDVDSNLSPKSTNKSIYEGLGQSLAISSLAFAKNLFLTQQDIDCLGLIIGGGSNRDEEVSVLSSLYPSHLHKAVNDTGDLSSSQYLCNDTLEWLEANLCVNESVYPSSPGASAMPMSPVSHTTTAASASMMHDIMPNSPSTSTTTILIASKVINHSGPVRIIYPLHVLNACRPTVVSGATSVIVHALAVNSGRYRSRSMCGSGGTNFNPTAFQESLTAAVRSTSGMSLDDEQSSDSNSINSRSNSGNGDVKETPFSPGTLTNPASSAVSWYDSNHSAENDYASASLANALTQSLNSAILSRLEVDKVSEFVNAQCAKSTTEALPHLILHGCIHTSLYFLSPYSTGSITSCSDCEIITGPIGGTIILVDCDRVRLTTIARKVILRNCFDCVINCQTLSPVIITGDSRGLQIGPYNTTYKDLPIHLELAALSSLIKPQYRYAFLLRGESTQSNSSASTLYNPSADSPPLTRGISSNDQEDPDSSVFMKQNSNGELYTTTTSTSAGISVRKLHSKTINNMWMVLWDATQAECVEQQFAHVNHAQQAEAAIAAAGGGSLNSFIYGNVNTKMLPPAESIASILPPDKYRFVTVPEQSQYQTIEHCPVEIPSLYLRSYNINKSTSAQLSSRVTSELNIPPPPPPDTDHDSHSSPPSSTSRANSKDDVHNNVNHTGENNGTNLLSGKFMEWLLTTGKASQVIELIRLDQQLQQQSNPGHSDSK